MRIRQLPCPLAIARGNGVDDLVMLSAGSIQICSHVVGLRLVKGGSDPGVINQ